MLADEGDGRIGGRLADLGLARLLSPGNTMTAMGQASSVEYTDPDLLAGARPSRRTEIWALGAIMHRTLAGTGLYGELPNDQPLLAMRRVLSDTPRVSPDLAPDAAALIGDCLATGTARLTTANEVADRLAALSR